jgi:hypothetical protein
MGGHDDKAHHDNEPLEEGLVDEGPLAEELLYRESPDNSGLASVADCLAALHGN